MTCSVSSGQACCSGGTPLSSSLGMQQMGTSQWQTQLIYDYNTQRDLVSGSKKLNDDNRERNTYAVLLRTSYAINERWTITGLFSWVQQEEINRIPGQGIENVNKLDGLGDIVFLTQYEVVADSRYNLSVAAGLKLPVGDNEITDDNGIGFNPDLQPGTGSWDFILGYNFVLPQFLIREMTLLFYGTYRLSTEDKRFNGLQPFRFGDEFQNFLGLKYQTFLGSQILEPFILLRQRSTQPNHSFGVDEPNTGGFWIHAVGGADWNLTPKWGVGIRAEVPLYRDLTGTQLTTDFSMRASVLYAFGRSRTDEQIAIPQDLSP